MEVDNKTLQEAVNNLILCGGNKAEAARSSGVPRTTFLGWLELASRKGIQSDILPPDQEAAIQSVRLQYEDRIRDLNTQILNTRRETLTAEGIRAYIFDLKERGDEVPKWTIKPKGHAGSPGTPTLFQSDFHWGEVVRPEEIEGFNNHYNREIAISRFKVMIEETVSLAKDHMVNPQYEGIVTALGGDMVAGDIHDELVETNDGTTMEHIFEMFQHEVAGLTTLADNFGHVFVPCTFGNHSRNTPKPRYKLAAFTSFDWLLCTMLENHFKAVGDDRIQFLIPSGFDTYYRVHNHHYLLTHGDRIGAGGGGGMVGTIGPITRGIIKLRNQYSNTGRTIDTVLLGHFHQPLDPPHGLVNSSLKGYDEFAMGHRFEPSLPSQRLWWTHPEHGITFRCEIFVAKKERPTSDPTNWISVLE